MEPTSGPHRSTHTIASLSWQGDRIDDVQKKAQVADLMAKIQTSAAQISSLKTALSTQYQIEVLKQGEDSFRITNTSGLNVTVSASSDATTYHNVNQLWNLFATSIPPAMTVEGAPHTPSSKHSSSYTPAQSHLDEISPEKQQRADLIKAALTTELTEVQDKKEWASILQSGAYTLKDSLPPFTDGDLEHLQTKYDQAALDLYLLNDIQNCLFSRRYQEAILSLSLLTPSTQHEALKQLGLHAQGPDLSDTSHRSLLVQELQKLPQQTGERAINLVKLTVTRDLEHSRLDLRRKLIEHSAYAPVEELKAQNQALQDQVQALKQVESEVAQLRDFLQASQKLAALQPDLSAAQELENTRISTRLKELEATHNELQIELHAKETLSERQEAFLAQAAIAQQELAGKLKIKESLVSGLYEVLAKDDVKEKALQARIQALECALGSSHAEQADLRGQLETAQRATANLRAEQDHLASNLQRSLTSIGLQTTQLRATIASQQEALEQSATTQSTLKAQLQEAQTDNVRYARQLRKVNDQLEISERRLTEVRQAQTRATQKAADAERSVQQAQASLRSIEQEKGALQANLTQLQQTLSDKGSLETAQQEQLALQSQQLQVLQELYTRAGEELEASRSDYQAQKEQLQTVQQENLSLTTLCELLTQTQTSLQATHASTLENLETTQRQLAAINEKLAHTQSLSDQQQQELTTQTAYIAELSSAYTSQQHRLQNSLQALKEQEALELDLNGRIEALQTTQQENQQVIASLNDTKQDLQTQLTESQHALEAQQQTLDRLQEQLIAALATTQEDTSTIQQLRGELLASQQQLSTQRQVFLEAKEKLSAHVAIQARQIDELELAHAQACRNRQTQAEQLAKELEEALTRGKDAHQELEQLKLAHQQELSQYQARYKQALEKLTAYEGTVQELASQLQQKQGDLKVLQATHSTLEIEYSNQERLLLDLKQTTATQSQQILELKAQSADVTARLEQVRQEHAQAYLAYETAQSALKEQLAQLSASNHLLSKKQADTLDRLQQTVTALEAQTAQSLQLQTQLTQKEALIATLQASLEADKNGSQTLLKAQQDQITALRKQKAALTIVSGLKTAILRSRKRELVVQQETIASQAAEAIQHEASLKAYFREKLLQIDPSQNDLEPLTLSQLQARLAQNIDRVNDELSQLRHAAAQQEGALAGLQASLTHKEATIASNKVALAATREACETQDRACFQLNQEKQALQTQLDQALEALAQAQTTHKASLEHLSAQASQLSSALQATQELEHQLDTLRLTSLKKQEELNQTVLSQTQTISALKAQLQNLNQEHAETLLSKQTLESQLRDSQQAYKTLEQFHSEQLAILQQQLKAAQDRNASLEASYVLELTKKTESIKQLELLLAQTKQDHLKEVAALKQSQQTDLDKLTLMHRQALEALQTSSSSQLEALKQEQQQEQQALKTEHQLAMEALISQHQSAIEISQGHLSTLQTTLDHLNQEHLTLKIGLRTIEEEKAQLQTSIEQLQQTTTQLKERLATQGEDHTRARALFEVEKATLEADIKCAHQTQALQEKEHLRALDQLKQALIPLQKRVLEFKPLLESIPPSASVLDQITHLVTIGPVIQAYLSSIDSSHDKTLSAKQARYEQLLLQEQSVQMQLVDQQSILESLRQRNSELETGLIKDQQLSDISQKLERALAKIKELNSTVGQLRSEKAALEERISQLRTDLSKQIRETAETKARNIQLASELTHLYQAILSLKTSYTTTLSATSSSEPAQDLTPVIAHLAQQEQLILETFKRGIRSDSATAEGHSSKGAKTASSDKDSDPFQLAKSFQELIELKLFDLKEFLRRLDVSSGPALLLSGKGSAL